MIAISLLLIGGVLGYFITGNLSFNVRRSPGAPWEGSITARSTSIKNNHGNVFVNIYNHYNGPIYVVDIVNEAGEVAKIATVANRINFYNRNGLALKSVDEWVIFKADIEGPFLTQTAIPTEGQIDVFFNSEDSSELTIRYYVRLDDSVAKLITERLELRDDGFYIKMPQ